MQPKTKQSVNPRVYNSIDLKTQAKFKNQFLNPKRDKINNDQVNDLYSTPHHLQDNGFQLCLIVLKRMVIKNVTMSFVFVTKSKFSTYNLLNDLLKIFKTIKSYPQK